LASTTNVTPRKRTESELETGSPWKYHALLRVLHELVAEITFTMGDFSRLLLAVAEFRKSTM